MLFLLKIRFCGGNPLSWGMRGEADCQPYLSASAKISLQKKSREFVELELTTESRKSIRNASTTIQEAHRESAD
jgi:hypothetical protein